jgi:hypothetical protein
MQASAKELALVFRGVRLAHLGPALLRGSRGVATDPHALPVRPLLSSILKAAYWAFDYTVGYGIKVWPSLVQSRLVFFDRYLVDVLVDPVRYRYGGPRWLVRAVWSVTPKPDILLVLDAPAEIVQSRKREVSPLETQRQRQAYLEIAAETPGAVVIDASCSLGASSRQVRESIFAFLTNRTEGRLNTRSSANESPDSRRGLAPS